MEPVALPARLGHGAGSGSAPRRAAGAFGHPLPAGQAFAGSRWVSAAPPDRRAPGCRGRAASWPRRRSSPGDRCRCCSRGHRGAPAPPSGSGQLAFPPLVGHRRTSPTPPPPWRSASRRREPGSRRPAGPRHRRRPAAARPSGWPARRVQRPPASSPISGARPPPCAGGQAGRSARSSCGAADRRRTGCRAAAAPGRNPSVSPEHPPWKAASTTGRTDRDGD